MKLPEFDSKTLLPGDLIFVGSPNSFWNLASREVGRSNLPYGHVGVLSFLPNRKIGVIHADGSPLDDGGQVRFDPIEKFLANYTDVGVYRARNIQMRRHLFVMSEKYFARGVKFDSDFDLNTEDRIYCTEMIWRILFDYLQRDPIPIKEKIGNREYVSIYNIASLDFFRRVK